MEWARRVGVSVDAAQEQMQAPASRRVSSRASHSAEKRGVAGATATTGAGAAGGARTGAGAAGANAARANAAAGGAKSENPFAPGAFKK